MEATLVLLGLALGLSVLLRILDDVNPFRVPAALNRIGAVVAGAGLAWALDYSVFTALGQDLRLAWMHPVMSGVVLVAVADLVNRLIGALAHRSGEPPVEAPSARGSLRAA